MPWCVFECVCARVCLLRVAHKFIGVNVESSKFINWNAFSTALLFAFGKYVIVFLGHMTTNHFYASKQYEREQKKQHKPYCLLFVLTDVRKAI